MLALSGAIPCYNEAEGLPELLRQVTAACRASVGDDYQIVLANDGSTDPTWSLIRSFAEQDPHITGVNLSRNHGHQLALTAALSYSSGTRILILDADLQDPPELLSDMMEMMRRRRPFEPTWFMASADRVPAKLPGDTGDFRLMSRRVLDVFSRCGKGSDSFEAWSPGSVSTRCRSLTIVRRDSPVPPNIRSAE